MNWLKNLISDEDGQGMVEYGLIIGLVAVLLIGVLVLFKDDIAAIFGKVGSELDTNGLGAGA
jgi:pilus assembly protein Flp/PilA